MIKPETKTKKIQERIKAQITKAKEHNLNASFYITDESVQKELRLRAVGNIVYNVDQIHYPKNLAKEYKHPLWQEMGELSSKIRETSQLYSATSGWEIIPINERLKEGPKKRAEAKANFIIEYGTQFLDNIKKFSRKAFIEKIRKQVETLQKRQKELAKEMRKINSEFISKRKQAREEKQRQEAESLKEGRFWDCEKETLKDYFHPPFNKNYLTDISEKWRAALFVECESCSYKRGDKSWGHKLVGTGRGYLCGIDDNGDEWGHKVFRLPQSYDQYDNQELDATVEEAMSELFGISTPKLSQCYRQGDLLFCPETAPEDTEFFMQEAWEVRESHKVSSNNLKRNGHYFKSDNPIYISHTSHEAIELPPGQYRLYEHQAFDAD